MKLITLRVPAIGEPCFQTTNHLRRYKGATAHLKSTVDFDNNVRFLNH